jgi:hypothetical protein
MTTLPTAVAASLALAAFLFLANLVLVQYGRGVAATAVEEAARRGAVVGGGPDVCVAAAEAVLADLLGGPFGRELAVDCWVSDDVIHATVAGRLPGLLSLVPDFSVDARASSAREMR